jgi:predicted NUDIX family phosphoesterase
MPRAAAENDPRFKQLIPYVILGCDGMYLSYVRGQRAGEGRLVGRRSIGIGGHINPADDMPLFGDAHEAYLAAVQREVAEEVEVRSAHTDRVVALLNDDSTEVGRVHLGIVHHWALQRPEVVKREQMITQLSFLSVSELQAVRESLETWSQFCLDQLERIAAV